MRYRAATARERFSSRGLRDFLNLAVADAGRAGANALVRSSDDRPHRLQINVPAAIGHVMSVAHLMSELRTFAAHFTNSGHFEKTPDRLDRKTVERKYL